MEITKDMPMKQKILILLWLIANINIFSNDLFTPKINHGELIELNVNTIAQTLGISEEDVKAHPPEKEGFGPIESYGEYHEFFQILSMIPRGFFIQDIPEEGLTFYRVMYEVEQQHAITDEVLCYERIFYQDRDTGEIILSYEDYMNYKARGWQLSTPEIEKGVMLIVRNGSYDGVMVYRLWYEDVYEMEDPPRYETKNRHEAFVYFFGDGEKTAVPDNFEDPDIHITASNPLIDRDDRFKYTIQNAFDQNPATSYVEDTEDDLMEVSISFSDEYYNALLDKNISIVSRRIINGYAQDGNLYQLNNRIKKEKSYELVDNFLDYQIMPRKYTELGVGYRIIVKDIYKGSKYNDTCLAEYDWKMNIGDWIFGGYDE